jgi:hypothetical protein
VWGNPSISFSSKQPCGTNRVVVALKFKFPVSTSCCTKLTLSGLTGARSKTNRVFALTSSSGFKTIADWELPSSRLIVTLAGDLKARQEYGFTFDVLNQATELDPTVFPSLSGCGLPSYNFTKGVQVSSLTHSAVEKLDTRTYPCTMYTISIKITPSVSLLNTCADSRGKPIYQHPNVTISGLSGNII